ncbi:hypothetical protein [Devosia sp. SL43]|uniref:hypothetical protein n=1 Tax=Devosia sp. SL43 TaxID=2806348 RepID=UPI001F2E96F6|nr:hypothetical protein [Devosia sp. SL43]UJW86033.1 hypothetical protein IM737_01725 [Devosia sp. SL43]
MTPIHTIARVAVVALTLGAASVSSMPAAFAQDSIGGFSLQVPGNQGQETQRSQTFGQGNQDDFQFRCLTNREVRRGIAAYGFTRVEISRELNRQRVEVRAVYRNWLYSMRVDKCSGEVSRIRAIRPAFGNGGGFGLHFNFGN